MGIVERVLWVVFSSSSSRWYDQTGPVKIQSEDGEETGYLPFWIEREFAEAELESPRG